MSETGLTYDVYDTIESMTPAEIYGHVLAKLGEEREDIVALTADLAKSTKIGKFGEKFPDRFFNVGIAEQDMVGIAAGLANGGRIPFVSAAGCFLTARAMEQIKARRYDERLREDGREDILAYGIAFNKKRCKAVCERLSGAVK